MVVKRATEQGQADSPELRKNIRETLINQELLIQEAKAKGLDKQLEVIEQIEAARQNILVTSYVQITPRATRSPKICSSKSMPSWAARIQRSSHPGRHGRASRRHHRALGKKVKFEKLAKKSKDAGSAEHGGSLGWTQPNRFVPPFAQALVELKKGEYTKKAVQSQYGWHIIKLDDVRDMKVPAYEELKPQLEQYLQQQAIQKAVTDLRAKAKVE